MPLPHTWGRGRGMGIFIGPLSEALRERSGRMSSLFQVNNYVSKRSPPTRIFIGSLFLLFPARRVC